jgi:hypothetical protein
MPFFSDQDKATGCCKPVSQLRCSDTCKAEAMADQHHNTNMKNLVMAN